MNQIIEALKKHDRKHKKAREYANLWMMKYNRYINSRLIAETEMGNHKASIIIPKIISKDDKYYVKYSLGPNQKPELVKVPAAYAYARNKVIESFQACGYNFNPYISQLQICNCYDITIDYTIVLHPELDPYYNHNIATHDSKPIYCDIIDVLW